jgi:hypothetical protein
MSFTPAIEHRGAEKVFGVTQPRGHPLSINYLVSADAQLWWFIVYGIAAYAEATLQDGHAKAFPIGS